MTMKERDLTKREKAEGKYKIKVYILYFIVSRNVDQGINDFLFEHL